MDESMVVRVDGTDPPTGLTDGNFYYVTPIDADTIQFSVVTDVSNDSTVWYIDDGVYLSTVALTDDGSGTITLREARMVYGPVNGQDDPLQGFQTGSGDGVPGSFAGTWSGDPGWQQNWLLAGAEFTSNLDFTDAAWSLAWYLNNTNGLINELWFIAIDGDGDWCSWKVYDLAVQGSGEIGPQYSMFQLADADAVAAGNEGGTFDGTNVQYIAWAVRGVNTSTGQGFPVWSLDDLIVTNPPFIIQKMQVVGGSSSSPLTFEYLSPR